MTQNFTKMTSFKSTRGRKRKRNKRRSFPAETTAFDEAL
jgi:hypothetical protein